MEKWKVVGPTSPAGWQVIAECIEGEFRGEKMWIDLIVAGDSPEGLTHENAIGRVFVFDRVLVYGVIACGPVREVSEDSL